MFLLGKQSKLPVNYLSKIYLPTLVPNRELKSERSGLSRLQTACDIYAAILLTNQERRGADGGRTLTARRGPGARCLVLPRALASVGGSGTRRQMMHRPAVHLPPPLPPARRGGVAATRGSLGPPAARHGAPRLQARRRLRPGAGGMRAPAAGPARLRRNKPTKLERRGWGESQTRIWLPNLPHTQYRFTIDTAGDVTLSDLGLKFSLLVRNGCDKRRKLLGA